MANIYDDEEEEEVIEDEDDVITKPPLSGDTSDSDYRSPINKIIFGGKTLIDLTEDTVNADELAKGLTAHTADGNVVTGLAPKTWTGTHADYDAEKSNIPNGTIVNFTDDYSSDGQDIYDDTERVVGTWFGKTRYRKTYDFGSIGVSNVFQYTKPLPSNVEMITRIYGIAYNSSNPKITRPLPMSDTSGLTNNIRLDTSGTDIRLIVGTAWTGYKAYVTIEYTKSN